MLKYPQTVPIIIRLFKALPPHLSDRLVLIFISELASFSIAAQPKSWPMHSNLVYETNASYKFGKSVYTPVPSSTVFLRPGTPPLINSTQYETPSSLSECNQHVFITCTN